MDFGSDLDKTHWLSMARVLGNKSGVQNQKLPETGPVQISLKDPKRHCRFVRHCGVLTDCIAESKDAASEFARFLLLKHPAVQLDLSVAHSNSAGLAVGVSTRSISWLLRCSPC